MKAAFGGILIANEKFTESTARLTVECRAADAVAFGKAAIANPDLVERIRNQAPWNEPKPQFFYGDGPQGYTDYPFLSQTTTA
jgi:2,4-dienoyl-CoA reductase-like NADH-dependent reductase (Old Yellow Enzyme family)